MSNPSAVLMAYSVVVSPDYDEMDHTVMFHNIEIKSPMHHTHSQTKLFLSMR